MNAPLECALANNDPQNQTLRVMQILYLCSRIAGITRIGIHDVWLKVLPFCHLYKVYNRETLVKNIFIHSKNIIGQVFRTNYSIRCIRRYSFIVLVRIAYDRSTFVFTGWHLCWSIWKLKETVWCQDEMTSRATTDSFFHIIHQTLLRKSSP